MRYTINPVIGGWVGEKGQTIIVTKNKQNNFKKLIRYSF